MAIDAKADPPHEAPNPAPGLRRSGGFRVGRVFGVDIHVDWSLLLIFLLIAFNLGTGVLPAWHPRWGPTLTWTTAVIAALLFFGSILAHELSHAIVARTQGVVVRQITLFMFGGVAHMEAEPSTPKAEFLIAIVGPIASFAIGVVGVLGGAFLSGPSLVGADPTQIELALSEIGPVATLLLWLGPINLVLGMFNLVPGFPLDGGRVLRALLWWASGDLTRATRWASNTSRVISSFLMIFGVVLAFRGRLMDGIWLVLIGWFLHGAARSSLQDRLLRDALREVPIVHLMRTHMESVSPMLSVAELVRRYWMASEQPVFPVERDGIFLGVVWPTQVFSVPPDEWAGTPVSSVMVPASELETLPSSASAEEALEAMNRSGVEVIPVLEEGMLLGWVGRTELVKWLALRARSRLAR